MRTASLSASLSFAQEHLLCRSKTKATADAGAEEHGTDGVEKTEESDEEKEGQDATTSQVFLFNRYAVHE